MQRINALTIAGTDPSGGPVSVRSKTFSALGAYGCSVITALVAQNTCGVQSVYRIEPDFVVAQLDSVFSDVRIDTTKSACWRKPILSRPWRNGYSAIMYVMWCWIR